MEKKRLIITVDKKLHRELKIFAAHNDTSINRIVNDAIAAYNYQDEQSKN